MSTAAERDAQAAQERADIRAQIDALNERFDKLEPKIDRLVTAWDGATGVITFSKWLAGIAAFAILVWNFWAALGPPSHPPHT